ncbi:MAG TPA: FG-GAP-like repeat-containing protein, partial [Terriglobales bacterium]|nr:FG-GAP-like repeat-containing protein [Terriglobales bacterium]
PGATKTYMTGFASGDFNNDGLPDLAIIECCGGFDVEMGDLIVLISRGDGTFDRRMVSQFSVPQDVTVYDLDKDGYADILTTFAGCHTPCAALAYFHNTRNDSFTQFGASVDESAYSTLRSPVAADFDGDGIPDVGVLARAHDQYSSYYNHDSLLIFKGTEPGAISSTYRDFRVTSDSSTLWAASIGDWNKDSKPDVAIASRERGSIYTLLNTGAGGPNCAISTVQPSVTVCTPAENATVTSPFRLVAKTNPSAYPTTYMRVYANGKAIYEAAVSSLDKQLSLAAGLYRLRVVAWNSNGQSYYQDRYITVSETTTGTCTLNYAQPSVTICEPTEGATVPNPVHLVAKTNPNQYPTTFMRVYANSQPVYEIAASRIDTNLNLGAGSWRIRVVAWNSAGQVYLQDRNITVTGSGGSICGTPTTDRTITICSPSEGSSVTSPVTVAARARWDGKTISHMRVYIDNVRVYDVDYPYNNQISTELSVAPGTHRMVIVAWESGGASLTSAGRTFSLY